MHERVRELEYKYKRYQRKKYLQRLIFTFAVFIVSYLGYKAFTLYTKQKGLLEQAFKAKQNIEQQLVKAKLEQEKGKIALAKFTQEKENLQESAKIQINSYDFDLKALKNAFYQNPSYEKALMMMKIYYKQKIYEKTLFWALKANEFDTSLQEPWLYFAKAKKALGEEKQAQEILELYTKHYGIITLDEDL